MKNRKKSLCALLALTLILACAACGQPQAQSEQNAAGTVTVIDHNGDSVTLPANAQRIVVCDILPLPSVLSVFFDSANNIVGMAEASMTAAKNSLLSELYPEILNAETGFIRGSEVNVEELMKLEPDVVFYNASSTELGSQLRQAGFPAVAISVNKWRYNAIETLDNWIALLSEIFPDNDKAQTVANYSNQMYEMIQQRVATLSDEDRAELFFLFQYSETNMMTSGANFFGQWWADAIGAKNVSAGLTQDNSVTVSLEQVYQWNPEKILITNFTTAQPDSLYTNAIGSGDWSGIQAVQNRQVYKMPLGMYRSYTPGVDTPITLLWLAKTVYPDLFADIDVTQQVIDYYGTVFGVPLTEAQAESIFAPPADAGEGF